MSKSRSNLQRIILIGAGLAFLGGTVLTSLSMIQGDRPNTAQNPEEAAQGNPAESEAISEQLISLEEGYVAVLEREPENPTALQGLVQTRVEMGKLEEALPPLETLQDLNPDDPQILQAIAAINIQLQNFPEALEPLKQLVEMQPDNEELKEQLAALEQIVEQGITIPPNPDTPATAEEPSPSDNAQDTAPPQ